MKKKSLLTILCALMMVMLMACSGGGGKSTSGEETTEKEVIGGDEKGATELKFWTFAELHMDFFKDAVPRWNELHPDKKVKLVAETFPFDQMHNNLLLALQSGKGAPDIVDIEVSRFPNYLQGEPQLLPMNEFVEPEKDNFIESRLDLYSKDGKYYGMPTHVGATVMYYNKEIMDKSRR
ncbi:ABC transporter substrate-binding protein [Neobacillus vireti]